jgi:hypothetical protein
VPVWSRCGLGVHGDNLYPMDVEREEQIRRFTEYVADYLELPEPERSQRLLGWRQVMREGQPLPIDWDAEERAKFDRWMEKRHGDAYREYRKFVITDE